MKGIRVSLTKGAASGAGDAAVSQNVRRIVHIEDTLASNVKLSHAMVIFTYGTYGRHSAHITELIDEATAAKIPYLSINIEYNMVGSLAVENPRQEEDLIDVLTDFEIIYIGGNSEKEAPGIEDCVRDTMWEAFKVVQAREKMKT